MWVQAPLQLISDLWDPGITETSQFFIFHRRKAHYNEFHAVKLAKELLAQEEDEDEVCKRSSLIDKT